MHSCSSIFDTEGGVICRRFPSFGPFEALFKADLITLYSPGVIRNIQNEVQFGDVAWFYPTVTVSGCLLSDVLNKNRAM